MDSPLLRGAERVAKKTVITPGQVAEVSESIGKTAVSNVRKDVPHSLAKFYELKKYSPGLQANGIWNAQVKDLAALSSKLASNAEKANLFDRIIFSTFYMQSKSQIRAHFDKYGRALDKDIFESAMAIIERPGSYALSPLNARHGLLEDYEIWLKSIVKTSPQEARRIYESIARGLRGEKELADKGIVKLTNDIERGKRAVLKAQQVPAAGNVVNKLKPEIDKDLQKLRKISKAHQKNFGRLNSIFEDINLNPIEKRLPGGLTIFNSIDWWNGNLLHQNIELQHDVGDVLSFIGQQSKDRGIALSKFDERHLALLREVEGKFGTRSETDFLDALSGVSKGSRKGVETPAKSLFQRLWDTQSSEQLALKGKTVEQRQVVSKFLWSLQQDIPLQINEAEHLELTRIFPKWEKLIEPGKRLPAEKVLLPLRSETISRIFKMFTDRSLPAQLAQVAHNESWNLFREGLRGTVGLYNEYRVFTTGKPIHEDYEFDQWDTFLKNEEISEAGRLDSQFRDIKYFLKREEKLAGAGTRSYDADTHLANINNEEGIKRYLERSQRMDFSGTLEDALVQNPIMDVGGTLYKYIDIQRGEVKVGGKVTKVVEGVVLNPLSIDDYLEHQLGKARSVTFPGISWDANLTNQQLSTKALAAEAATKVEFSGAVNPASEAFLQTVAGQKFIERVANLKSPGWKEREVADLTESGGNVAFDVYEQLKKMSVNASSTPESVIKEVSSRMSLAKTAEHVIPGVKNAGDIISQTARADSGIINLQSEAEFKGIIDPLVRKAEAYRKKQVKLKNPIFLTKESGVVWNNAIEKRLGELVQKEPELFGNLSNTSREQHLMERIFSSPNTDIDFGWARSQIEHYLPKNEEILAELKTTMQTLSEGNVLVSDIAQAAMTIFNRVPNQVSIAESEGFSHMIGAKAVYEVSQKLRDMRGGLKGNDPATNAIRANLKKLADDYYFSAASIVEHVKTTFPTVRIPVRDNQGARALIESTGLTQAQITGTKKGQNVHVIKDSSGATRFNGREIFEGQEAKALSLNDFAKKVRFDKGQSLLYDAADYTSNLTYVDHKGQLMVADSGRNIYSEIDRYHKALVQKKGEYDWLDIELTRAPVGRLPDGGFQFGAGKGLQIGLSSVKDGVDTGNQFRGYSAEREAYLEFQSTNLEIAAELRQGAKESLKLLRDPANTKYETDKALLEAFSSHLKDSKTQVIAGHNVTDFDLVRLGERARMPDIANIGTAEHFESLIPGSLDSLKMMRLAGIHREAGSNAMEDVAQFLLEQSGKKGKIKQTHDAWKDIELNKKIADNELIKERLTDLYKNKENIFPVSFGEQGLSDVSNILRGKTGSEHGRIVVPIGFQEVGEGAEKRFRMLIQEIDPLSNEIRGGLRHLTSFRTPFGKANEVVDFASKESAIKHLEENFDVTTFGAAKQTSNVAVDDLIENRLRKLLGGRRRTSLDFLSMSSEQERISIAASYDKVLQEHRIPTAGLKASQLQSYQQGLQIATDEFADQFGQNRQKDFIHELQRNPSLQRQMTDPRYVSRINDKLAGYGIFNLSKTLSTYDDEEIANSIWQESIDKLKQVGMKPGKQEITGKIGRFSLNYDDLSLSIKATRADRAATSLENALNRFGAKSYLDNPNIFSGINKERNSILSEGAQYAAEQKFFGLNDARGAVLDAFKGEVKSQFKKNKGFREAFLAGFPAGMLPEVVTDLRSIASHILNQNAEGLIGGETKIVDSFLNARWKNKNMAQAQEEFIKETGQITEAHAIKYDIKNKMQTIEGQNSAMEYLSNVKLNAATSLGEQYKNVAEAIRENIRKTHTTEVGGKQVPYYPAFFNKTIEQEMAYNESVLGLKGTLEETRPQITKDFLMSKLSPESRAHYAKEYQFVNPQFAKEISPADEWAKLNERMEKGASQRPASQSPGVWESFAEPKKLPTGAEGPVGAVMEDTISNAPLTTGEVSRLADDSLAASNFADLLKGQTRTSYNSAKEALSYTHAMQSNGYDLVEAASRNTAKALHSNWQTASAALMVGAPMLALIMSQRLRDSRPERIAGHVSSDAGAMGMYTPKNDLAEGEKRETWQTGNMRPFNVTVNVKGRPTDVVEDEETLIQRVTGTIKEHFGISNAGNIRNDSNNRASVKHQADAIVPKIF